MNILTSSLTCYRRIYFLNITTDIYRAKKNRKTGVVKVLQEGAVTLNQSNYQNRAMGLEPYTRPASFFFLFIWIRIALQWSTRFSMCNWLFSMCIIMNRHWLPFCQTRGTDTKRDRYAKYIVYQTILLVEIYFLILHVYFQIV